MLLRRLKCQPGGLLESFCLPPHRVLPPTALHCHGTGSSALILQMIKAKVQEAGHQSEYRGLLRPRRMMLASASGSWMLPSFRFGGVQGSTFHATGT